MKTNVLSLLSLSIIGTFSASTYAVEGGTSLTWSEHPYLTESLCTGTVIAGQYMLIAGHCGASVDNPFPLEVHLSNGTSIMPTRREHLYDPALPVSKFADVAIWTLPSTAPMDKVVFIADLNDAASTVKIGDNISFMGFGQDDNTPRLGQAFNTVTKLGTSGMRITYEDAIAHSVPGDSGAPVFNTDNKIIGVNYAAGGTIDPGTGRYDQNGVNLHFVKNWLLETIDRWHSATELKLTGTQTFDVQSLHVNDVDMASRWNDGSLTTGDVSITGGTCVTDGVVAPFGMCTLEITSSGGEGKIALEEGNDITLNRVIKPTPKPIPPSDSGSSGGSFGFASILGLLALLWRRKC